MLDRKLKLVVVGGGTGTYTLLRGLKRYSDLIDLSVVVTMADSGGSTGRLRDEFGQLPVGDVRQALAALSTDMPGTPNLLRDLFLYRFDRGSGLEGHNFGNLFLTALSDLLGSEVAAIEAASTLLRVSGRIIPVTTDRVHLEAHFSSGRVVVGEHEIDEPQLEYYLDRIVRLSLTPSSTLSAEACEVLTNADYIIFGPGDFYTSILSNAIVPGFKEAIQSSQAKMMFVANLMARPGQTIGMNLRDYLDEFLHYIEVVPEFVLVPDTPLPEDLLLHYANEESVHPVAYEKGPYELVNIVAAPIVSFKLPEQQKGDVLVRSLIRHDSDALAREIMTLLHSNQ